jgi:hypothetical protein
MLPAQRLQSGSADLIQGAWRAPAVVIITGLEPLCDAPGRPNPDIRRAIRALAESRVPVVVWTGGGPEDAADAQRAFGISAPFVCDHGSRFCVSASDLPMPALDSLRLAARRVHEGGDRTMFEGDAAGFVASLYRALNPDVVLVGVGSQLTDFAFLRRVDIPVLVRLNEEVAADALPGVFVPERCGPSGWIEAVLGPDAV